ncbi:YutD family protein [Caldalkalibacillus mannanilyticus]|uniref:YutD family protein n=1 Tax=Caldalkalibacillus mannanilyticus TaxID=1418 RepID=UPI00046AC4B2|nr:YutD-like domain-containing protein [Caldalkalibacillus mannanilyticus]
MIQVQGCFYEVVQNVREGWNVEAFKERYSEVLAKYDYVVGDWGYSQLRLRGFYDDHNKKAKASYDNKISTLDEYILEYCNFGCPYFVAKRVNPPAGYTPVEEQQATEEATQVTEP